MLLDSWNQLLLTVPWPLWLPRWSLALVLPTIGTDSPSAWDLRYDVRERLIQWVRVHHPESLPRERLRITGTVRSAQRQTER